MDIIIWANGLKKLLKKLENKKNILYFRFRKKIETLPKFAKRKKWSKRRIPPQTPPPPLATSEFKKESAEVLPNPSPRK